MSTMKVNTIVDSPGTGAPEFPNGVRLSSTNLTGIATQAEAQAGTANTSLMTPLRTKEAIASQAPIGKVFAWVLFDGVPSTPNVLASGNVSSVTKNITGDYTITFQSAAPNSNYIVTTQARRTDSTDQATISGEKAAGLATRSTTQIRVLSTNTSGTRIDSDRFNVVVMN
jgi:hypothetical protein